MSPLVDDRFSGHLALGDPRGPLSAAGGCTWPTIPAYRYWLASDDATGDLAFFNVNPVRIEFASTQPAHDSASYALLGTHHQVSAAFVGKFYNPATQEYIWGFNINVIAIPEAPLNFFILRSTETCNRDHPLPNTFAFDIDRGVTGDTFRMEQIEWDRLAPPPSP